MFILRANNGVLLQEKQGKNIVYQCKNTQTGEVGFVNNTWVRENIKNIENAVIENGKVVFGVKEKKATFNAKMEERFWDILGADKEESIKDGYIFLEDSTDMGRNMPVDIYVENMNNPREVLKEFKKYVENIDVVSEAEGALIYYTKGSYEEGQLTNLVRFFSAISADKVQKLEDQYDCHPVYEDAGWTEYWDVYRYLKDMEDFKEYQLSIVRELEKILEGN